MGAYTLLQDLTVASNSTSVVLNNFGTITKDDFIKVEVTILNVAGSSNRISLLANSSVDSDYHEQQLLGNGSSVSANRNNRNAITFPDVSENSFTRVFLKLSENNRLNLFSNDLRDLSGNDLLVRFDYITSSGATFTSGITSLTVIGTATNGLGTGSRIQIYRLDAEKVADFVTTSNSTQVDIPFPTGTFSPAIDKDSEYLLVSDFDNNVASAGFIRLMVNDATTVTAYHNQLISSSGSATGSERNNAANYIETAASLTTLAYTHIKLSNIGAFTYQSYNIGRPGSTTPFQTNLFGSSTAENITSITKLNIVASTSNAIKAGSRFTLYKLYE